MGSMSLMHWLIVLVVAVLLFGNRLPGIGKSLGEGIKNFKDGLGGEGKDTKDNNVADKNNDQNNKPQA
jgi:sec-independent protein translocase protein TatA